MSYEDGAPVTPRWKMYGVPRTGWVGYAAAILTVMLMTLFIARLPGYERINNISMLYLIVVFGLTIGFGRGPGIAASIAAFLTFNYFFVEPKGRLTVADPGEWVALVLFLFAALITGQLAARERLRAEQAMLREREAVVLYEVVQLLSAPDMGQTLTRVAERLRGELGLQAISIEILSHGTVQYRAVAGEVQAQAFEPPAGLRMRESVGSQEAASQRTGLRVRLPHPRHWAAVGGRERMQVVPVVSSRLGFVGDLLLVHSDESLSHSPAHDRLLSAVATQLGIAVERDRLRREAMETDVLRRADELKNALLDAVSHDLRTPLASIIASASSLLQEGVAWTGRDRTEFAQAIEAEARRLDRIVGNLLDLSRVRAGDLKPTKGWYDLGALVDDVLGRLGGLTFQHRVLIDVPETLPPVPLDYVEIDQVLSNLIENAVKYSPPGGEIRISARLLPEPPVAREGKQLTAATLQAEAQHVAVSVEDEGPGIDPAELPHIFDSFYRGGDTGARPRGTGLGLAVARRLVEAHGGYLTAQNRAEGGARFSFVLPLAQQELMQADATAPSTVSTP